MQKTFAGPASGISPQGIERRPPAGWAYRLSMAEPQKKKLIIHDDAQTTEGGTPGLQAASIVILTVLVSFAVFATALAVYYML